MPKVKFAKARAVSASSVWASESEFSQWLHEHLSELGEAMGCDLQSYGREIPVGRFKADLAAEMDGYHLVAIENQLDASDHSHLGQSMTYAAGLRAHAFIWIAPTFRSEHLKAVEQLNIGMAGNLWAFAVQIEVTQVGESQLVPRFEILASPDNWFPHSGEKIDYRMRRGTGFFQRICDESGDETMQVGYSSAGKYGASADSSAKDQGISYSLWLRGGDATKGSTVMLWIENESRQASVTMFEHLRKDEDAINREVGHKLRWERGGPGRSPACIVRWLDDYGSIDAPPQALAQTRADMLDRYHKLRAAFEERLPAAIAAANQ